MTLIGTATLAASIVIYTQKKGIVGHRPSRRTMRWARRFGRMLMIKMPLLMLQAYALKAKQEKLAKRSSQRKQSVWQKWQKIGRDLRRPTGGGDPNMIQASSSRTTPEANLHDLIQLKKMRYKRRSFTEMNLGSMSKLSLQFSKLSSNPAFCRFRSYEVCWWRRSIIRWGEVVQLSQCKWVPCGGWESHLPQISHHQLRIPSQSWCAITRQQQWLLFKPQWGRMWVG